MSALWMSLVVLASAQLVLASPFARLGGRVVDPQGRPLQSARVVLRSAELLHERSAQTDGNGNYLFYGLLPGDYTLSYSLEGRTSVEQRAIVELGRITRTDAVLEPAEIEETVFILAVTSPAVETSAVGANFGAETVDALALDRGVGEIVALTPGIEKRTPRPSLAQVSVTGSFAYDNLFLLDGGEVTDGSSGSGADLQSAGAKLYIEDAILETQVLTTSVPAEYGRFSGGVVNVITRSGGIELRGSLRVDASNPHWREQTSLESDAGVSRPDDLDTVLSATLGGALLDDRLFYFVAGHDGDLTEASVFGVTLERRLGRVQDRRYHAKLGASLGSRHQLTSVLQTSDSDLERASLPISIDPATVARSSVGLDLLTLSYDGALRSRWFVEIGLSRQRSEMDWLDPVVAADLHSAPLFTLTQEPAHYGAPFLDPRQPAQMDRDRLHATVSYFADGGRFGSHDLRIGVEGFASRATGRAQVGSSTLLVRTDYLAGPQGEALLDDDGRLQPVFVPGRTQLLGSLLSPASDVEVHSVALHASDRWLVDGRWSLEAGLRFEGSRATESVAGGDADFGRLLPRLVAAYDPRRDGSVRIEAGYAEYSGDHSGVGLARGAGRGGVGDLTWLYEGPGGGGFDFAPGFDFDLYTLGGTGSPSTVIGLDESLSAPLTQELTLTTAVRLGPLGYVELSWVRRHVSEFVEDFTLFENGTSIVPESGNGLILDNTLVRNTGEPDREYEALQVQGSIRLRKHWYASAHWTEQLRNHGNFESDSPTGLEAFSPFGDYPEILVVERSAPSGRLRGFRERRARAWTVYERPLGKLGTVALGALYRYDSKPYFSALARAAQLSDVQIARDPGYALPPAAQDVFFGRRGAFGLDRSHRLDLSLRYSLPLASIEPWIKFEIRNVGENQARLGAAGSVLPRLDGPLDSNGVWTEFLAGAGFGEPRRPEDLMTPREYRVSAGIRF